MRGLSTFGLLAAIFLLAPFSFLGLLSYLQEVDIQQRNVVVLSEDKGADQVTTSELLQQNTVNTPVGTPCPKSILPAESEFWLPEITDFPMANLEDDAIKNFDIYGLYKVPSEDWVKRAEAKLAKLRPGLKDALRYVNDGDQRITVVTCLFDLGRDKLEGFKRPFNEYIARFQRIVDLGFPMVIFMEGDKVSMLNWVDTKKIMVIPFTIKDLVAKYPRYFERIEQIRHSTLYKRQADHTGWLAQSPQANLKHYNLMVMTKLFLLRYGAQLNPFHTQYHMFLDAGHLCGSILKTNHVNTLRKYMGKMMITYFDYGAGLHGESHGMTQKAYRYYVGPPYNNPSTWEQEWCCRIVRGGIFGGTPAYIEAAAEVYNEVLAQSLADGYMGTEENIFGAAYYRFPELFNAHKNEGGDNCAIFSASKRPGPDQYTYVHGNEPDEWHV